MDLLAYIRENILAFAVISSLTVNFTVLACVVTPYYVYVTEQRSFVERQMEAAESYTQARLLIEPPKEEQEQNDTETPLASEVEVRGQGRITYELGYNMLGDNSGRVVPALNQQPNIPTEESPNAEREEENEVEPSEVTDGHINVTQENNNTESQQSIQTPLVPLSEGQIATLYNENEELKMGFASDGNVLVVGTKWEEHAAYYRSIIQAVGASWEKSIPVAHYYGLFRSDMIGVGMSIDSDGKIEYVSVVQESKLGQQMLQDSTVYAVKYAGYVDPPPEKLMREYGVNGKIYIPFHFQYIRIEN